MTDDATCARLRLVLESQVAVLNSQQSQILGLSRELSAVCTGDNDTTDWARAQALMVMIADLETRMASQQGLISATAQQLGNARCY